MGDSKEDRADVFAAGVSAPSRECLLDFLRRDIAEITPKAWTNFLFTGAAVANKTG